MKRDKILSMTLSISHGCLCAHGSAEFFNAKRLFAMNNSAEPWKSLRVSLKGRRHPSYNSAFRTGSAEEAVIFACSSHIRMF